MSDRKQPITSSTQTLSHSKLASGLEPLLSSSSSSTTSSALVPYTPQSQAPTITLRLKDQAGVETFIKTRVTTKFSGIIAGYLKSSPNTPATSRFLFDGLRINPDATPESLDMEEGDLIDVLSQQTGGRRV